MAEARSRERWAHTSSLLALLANAHRDPKRTRAFVPADFNPHAKKAEPVRERVNISVLKAVFVDRRT
jgi:hypothetical protein